MNPTTKHILAGGAAFLIWGATSFAASANYLGYANGDPGNWDFYQEQHNGASPPTTPAVAAPNPGPYRHSRGVYRRRMYDEGYYGLGAIHRPPNY
jgi:hypothetical protein